MLGDDHPRWRPDRFGYDLWGCELSFRFPTVKLLDFTAVRPTLETSADPIAAMILAHLATLEEPDDEGSRFARKRQVIRSLYDRGMSKEMVWELLRLIDWMMTLPEALEPLFRQEHDQWEKEKQMPYVTSFERLAREEGRAEGQAEGLREGLREGLLEAIELGLKLRFGTEGLQCLPAIQQLVDIAILRRIKQAIETAANPDDIRRLLP